MDHFSPAVRQSRILDAAEQAFADHGYAGASLREIVRKAGVNLATVYYYFDSKERLMQEVLRRRFGPLREEQRALLREAEEKNHGKPLPLSAILKALLIPPLRLAIAGNANHEAVKRLIGRIVTDPDPATQAALRRQGADVKGAFLAAFQRSLPRCPANDLRWRLEFVWGALAFTLCNPRRLEQETAGACDPVDAETVLAQMLAFFLRGFGAPPCEKS